MVERQATSGRGEVVAGAAACRDGTRIAYSLHESPQARGRIALIHSLAMDRSFWDPVAERLGGAASLLVYDCRGHGASDKPAGPYSVELFADDLADLMRAVGWDRAVVAGASMGGCTALAFAARHAERAAGLGLVDTTAWYGPQAPQDWEGRAQKALTDGMAALVEFQKTRWFSDRFRQDDPETVDKAIEVFLANDVAAYAEACRMLGACDQRAALPALTMPVRIIVGEEDYATPVAMAEAMHAAIPGAHLTILPAVRHFAPLEAPAEVASELLNLLAEGGTGQPLAG
jgi:3-oxoadipate enol-lactonase